MHFQHATCVVFAEFHHTICRQRRDLGTPSLPSISVTVVVSPHDFTSLRVILILLALVALGFVPSTVSAGARFGLIP